jgi:hypothetical protein
MKVLSIWQPFAGLIVKGYKTAETRTWAPPKSLIGQTIGIAATKTILPAQRAHFESEEFQQYYDLLGLPDRIEDMPLGYLLGTATLMGFDQMTEEVLEDTSEEEQAYGWWELDFFAWRLVDPIELKHPIPIRGRQGIYDWEGDLTDALQESRHPNCPQRTPDLWRRL